MTERDRLIELMCNAKRDDPESGSFTEWLADYLLANGVIVPPVRLGDKIYVVIYDFILGKWYIGEETVTEVGSRGCLVSGYLTPRDDMETFFPWGNFGVQVDNEIACFSREEAERYLEEKNDT